MPSTASTGLLKDYSLSYSFISSKMIDKGVTQAFEFCAVRHFGHSEFPVFGQVDRIDKAFEGL